MSYYITIKQLEEITGLSIVETTQENRWIACTLSNGCRVKIPRW